ncbi:MAG: hypothetical protein J0H01_22890 [Rhizobiales bacterium]|nr:hypothetical protein [Hyphomicrobiales bacterium]
MARALMVSIAAALTMGVIAPIALAPAAMAQDIQSEYRQVQALAYRCMQESAASQQQRALYAAQGVMMPQPQCFAYMPQWTARMWQLEAAMQRANGYTGDSCQLNPIRGCEAWLNGRR